MGGPTLVVCKPTLVDKNNCPPTAMQATMGRGVALDGFEWSASRPGRALPAGKRHSVPTG
jgi:hypothetical protein